MDLEQRLKDESFVQKLKQAIRKRVKLKMKKPKIVIHDLTIKFDNSTKDEVQTPLFVNDIQRFVLHVSVLKEAYHPRWCKVLRKPLISKVVCLILNDLSMFMSTENDEPVGNFFDMVDLFKDRKMQRVDFTPASVFGRSFIDEFGTVPLSFCEWKKLRHHVRLDDTTSDTTPDATEQPPVPNTDFPAATKTSLLLNPVQLIALDYPLPFDSSRSDTDDYVFAQEQYLPVHDSSPLFCIDCEMCLSVSKRQDAVWIAVVDENLECVYQSYIKPTEKVLDYVTWISGVSASTLDDCNVTLEDVQKKLRSILPPDAILVGHSLSFDLHALKLFHPYVIDTSVIYNIYANTLQKPSLKTLAAQFLNRVIQEHDRAHDPVEDAIAAMELVKLKLKNGIAYGDAGLGGFQISTQNSRFLRELDRQKCKTFVYNTGTGITHDIFDVIKERNVLFIGQEQKDEIRSNVATRLFHSNKAVKDAVIHNIAGYDILFCQFYGHKGKQKTCQKLNRYVKCIYDALSEDSLFVVIFGGSDDSKMQGSCFCMFKAEELKQPFEVDGTLVPYDFSLKSSS